MVGPVSPHVLEAEIDGDKSLYNPRTEKVTILNGTASDIWRLADGEHTVGEIIDLLAASYQVEAFEIAGDVESAIAQLSQAGLIDSP